MRTTKLFRKRTGEIVEAKQFVSSPDVELDIVARAYAYRVEITVEHEGGELTQLRIPMPDGEQFARSGDWIVRDGSGQFWLCWPEIFKEMYDPA